MEKIAPHKKRCDFLFNKNADFDLFEENARLNKFFKEQKEFIPT